jgi:hypothetical protein
MFQPLIVALIALIAAGISARVIWLSASQTDRRERETESERLKRLQASFAIRLSQDARRVIKQTSLISGSIRALAAANKNVSDGGAVKLRLTIAEHLDDRDGMASLPVRLQKGAFELEGILRIHNGYVSPGSSFAGNDILQVEVNRVLDLARSHANRLSGELETFARDIEQNHSSPPRQ